MKKPLNKPVNPSIETLARRLVEKMDLIHNDSAYRSVWFSAPLHQGPYTGPQYVEEINALREALKEKAPDRPTTPLEARIKAQQSRRQKLNPKRKK